MNYLKSLVLFWVLTSQLPVFAQSWDLPIRGSWLSDGLSDNDLVLVSDDRMVDIIVSPQAHSAVRRAAEFLAADIEKITSRRPSVLTEPRAGNVSIHLVTIDEDEIPAVVGEGSLAGKWEAFRIVTADNEVWLVGSNPRGTAFASYTFSERLGIDPLYHWTGYTPEHRDVLALKAIDFETGEPSFKYRGLFHDDEDILPTPLDKNGYPQYAGGKVDPIWYERYFETALRLRLNQVAPFVRVLRPFELQKKASDWGLFYTSHHYDILLSNPFGYDRFELAQERGISGAYNWSSNQQGILEYWRAGVDENKDLDVIWPVGLRGTADTSYRFPEGTTQAEKNEAFTDAIQNQVDMTKALVSKEIQPVFHFTLYGEMLRNYQRGSFDFPEDVILVWNDTGDGLMRALPEQLGKWKHGIYYHLAYYGATTKQTHHTIRPDRIESEFRKIVEAGATEYLLFNVSEMREFVMNTRFLAEISWDAETAFSLPDAADRFTKWWSREYFGDMAAEDAYRSYNAYFDILHSHDQIMEGAKNVDRTLNRLMFRLRGDHHVHTTDTDKENLKELRGRLSRYDSAFSLVESAMSNMNEQQKRFFFENVELGLLMDYRPTKAASHLNEALGKYPDSEALAYGGLALEELERLEQELSKAERSPFENWYKDTWIRRKDSWTNPHYSYYRLKYYLDNYESRYK